MGQHVKEVYYFSHDANARNDPKISKLRVAYGLEGYAIYWIIIEMLREQSCYKLSLSDYDAIAMQSQCDPDTVHNLINDSIEKFKLFMSDGEYFWSNSLLKRMEQKADKSEKARQAALSRWNDKKEDANAMRTHSERNASKVKESKVKEKDKVKFTPPSIDEIKQYCKERNNNIDPEQFHAFYSAKGWMVGSNKMKDWKQAVITWEKRDKSDSGNIPEYRRL